LKPELKGRSMCTRAVGEEEEEEDMVAVTKLGI
jgi:hypothetical protein